MSDNSKIEWTDATWNPLSGCSEVSPGCQNCYAAVMARRLEAMGQAKYAGTTRQAAGGKTVWSGKINLDEAALAVPLRAKKPTRYFVNSMSDLFHADVPEAFIDKVFAVMALAPRHTFQVLTKRAERMAAYLGRCSTYGGWGKPAYEMARAMGWASAPTDENCLPVRERIIHPPLPNVWLGVSVEDEARLARLDHLTRTPAAVRWVSAEPLLSALPTLYRWLNHHDLNEHGEPVCAACGVATNRAYAHFPVTCWRCAGPMRKTAAGIDWVVAGGESGHGARPMHPDWARDVRDQCQAAGVPYFFKQWGEWKPISEMPEAEHQALYRPNRVARAGENQALIDEAYGRTCAVPNHMLQYDGRPGAEVIAGHVAYLTFNVGKKAAGRTLDGRTHDEYPAPAA